MLAYLATVKPAAEIPLLPEPLPFYENISASSVVEQQNINYVKASMRLRTSTVVTQDGVISVMHFIKTN